MAYCKWCGSSIDACYGQCEGAKKARQRSERKIVTDLMHNFGLPTFRTVKSDAPEQSFEEKVLAALENIERRLSAVERDSHKQVTTKDLSDTIQRQLRGVGVRTRKFC